MENRNILKLGVTNFLALAIGFMILSPVANGVAVANDFSGSSDGVYPYEQTFVISAYYSPLPCQQKYATGSYDADIRLNGHGLHGADGTDVYPGMIAAPKGYPFGMKMQIPEIGIVSVHDRGGAIVPAEERGYKYDRLDIWMGYGDNGLKRALNWGKRTVTATVYGITDSVIEDIYLSDYSEDEYIPNECTYTVDTPSSNGSTVSTALSIIKEDEGTTKLAKKYNLELAEKLSSYLEPGVKNNNVRRLQEELRRLNFYRTEPTGVYDEVTKHAVFKFQQSQGIVGDKDETGAGIFGPKTRGKINEIIASRNERKVLIARATTDNDSYIAKDENKDDSALIASEMDFGVTSPEVKKLQVLLKEKGYFAGESFTDHYGVKTKDAVLRFQKENGVISTERDRGAGRVGPTTLKLLNSMS